MATASRGHEILLTKGTKKVELDHDALGDFFSKPIFVGKPIVIVSMASDVHHGESFLMNFFLRYLQNEGWKNDSWMGDSDTANEGFDWKDTRDKRQLKVWSEPFLIPGPNGQEVAVVLAEAEQIVKFCWMDRKEKAEGTKIIALSNVASSIQIFHTFKTDGSSDYKADWNSLELQLDEVKSTSAKIQSLYMFIEDDREAGSMEVTTDPDIRRNFNLHSLESCFEKVKCYRMPQLNRGVVDSSINGTNQELNPRFLEHMKAFVEEIFDPQNIVIKTFNQKEITAKRYVEVLEDCDRVITGQNPKTERPESSAGTGQKFRNWGRPYKRDHLSHQVEIPPFVDSTKKQIPCKEGGQLESHGCILSVPPGVLEEDETIKMEIETRSPKHGPENCTTIAPSITCEREIRLKKDSELDIQLPTFAKPKETAEVAILTRLSDADSWTVALKTNLKAGARILAFKIGQTFRQLLPVVLQKTLKIFEFPLNPHLFYQNDEIFHGVYVLDDELAGKVIKTEYRGFKNVIKTPQSHFIKLKEKFMTKLACIKKPEIVEEGEHTFAIDEGMTIDGYCREEFTLKEDSEDQQPQSVRMQFTCKMVKDEKLKSYSFWITWPSPKDRKDMEPPQSSGTMTVVSAEQGATAAGRDINNYCGRGFEKILLSLVYGFWVFIAVMMLKDYFVHILFACFFMLVGALMMVSPQQND